MDLASTLIDIVGPHHVLSAADVVLGYTTDWTGRFVGKGSVVVRPGSTEEVAAIVATCRSEGVGIVPQGGNTGLVGGSVPFNGEVVVSLRRLDDVGDVDPITGLIIAGAGSTLASVQQAAARTGRRYAIDMGSRDSATIGGTVATNAGGLNLIRYGGTREQLVGVEAVLGSGSTVSAMSGLPKDNTGYHFPSLLCGSEGTLGIVTRVLLRTVTAVTHRATALVAFSSWDEAVQAVSTWRSELPDLEAAEVMTGEGIELVSGLIGLPSPLGKISGVQVLVELAGVSDPAERLAEAVESVAGVVGVAVAADDRHRRLLWRFREEHTAAINRLGPPHKFDVTLPLPRLGEFVEEARHRIASSAPEASLWVFGHVGDGNLHLNVTGVDSDHEEVDDLALSLVIEMGGSISAEHGIGTAKVRHLEWQHSHAHLEAMRSIRRSLDPAGVLNPTVLVPISESGSVDSKVGEVDIFEC